jgi:ABC-type glycerol-3-phosphate transport system substrate-binding protein
MYTVPLLFASSPRKPAVNRLITLPLLAALLTAIAGCPEPEAPKAVEQPFAGQTVTLLVPDALGLRVLWQAPLTEWSAQTGAQGVLKEYGPADVEDLAAAIQANQATMVLFPFERIGDLLGANALGALPESQLSESGLQWNDLYTGLREVACTPGRRAAIVPVSCPVLVCYYRADLLKKAGLSAPSTWDDYQQLLDRLNEWAPGLTAVEPWGEDFRATMFLARAAAHGKHPGNFSFFFDVDTAAPLIDGPGFVRALEGAQAAVAKMPESIWNWNPSDCRAELLAGRAALAIGCEPVGFGPAAGAGAPAIERGDDVVVGVCRLPGTRDVYNASRELWESLSGKEINAVSLVGFGGWGAAVTHGTGSIGAEASVNAWTRLAGEDLFSGYPPGAAGLCRESQSLSVQRWAGPHLTGEEAGRYVVTVAQSLRYTRLVVELPVPQREDFRKALTNGITRALRDGMSPAESLQGVAENWRGIVKDIGSEKVRDTYRAALGMAAH